MKYLELNGTPKEMGLQHGESFREDIHSFAASRKDLLRTYYPKDSEDDIKALAQSELDVLKKYHDEYEEFCGIASGASIDLLDLVILNNYTDMRNFPDAEGGCSAIYYKDESSTVIGQTWDMTPEALPYTLHLKINGEPSMHVLTVTGCLALCGLSSNRLGVFMNDLKTNETSNGLIWPVLIRALLKQKSAFEAAEFLKKNMPASGHHYLIGDLQNAYSIETTGQRHDVYQELNGHGATCHTNHYLGKMDGAELEESLGPSTFTRLDCLKDYFGKDKKRSLDSIATDLFGTALGEGGVAMVKGNPTAAAITCAGIMMDLNTMQGYAFPEYYQKEKATAIKL